MSSVESISNREALIDSVSGLGISRRSSCACTTGRNTPCPCCGGGPVSEAGTEETLKQQQQLTRADSRRSSQLHLPIPSQQLQQQPLQQPLFVQTFVQPELDKINAINAAAKACACEECVRQREQQQQQLEQGNGDGGGGGRQQQQLQQQQNQQSMAGPSSRGGGGFGNANNTFSGPATSSSGASQQMMMFCNGPSTQQQPTQTIEEQIKQIDRISKECDNSRKSLESINRRLDDLNDEVRRYREFLGHEKTRRDPALYKTQNTEPLSAYNDSICRLIDSLTCQLTLEWTEKLRSIQNQTISKFASEKG